MDGHHLVINYFVLGDQVVMTPTFMGSEPTFIAQGEHQGLRTFVDEEQKGLDFYQSLWMALWDRKKPRPGPVKTHIHTVVRTPNGNDYGKDLLKEHLEQYHKHEKNK